MRTGVPRRKPAVRRWIVFKILWGLFFAMQNSFVGSSDSLAIGAGRGLLERLSERALLALSAWGEGALIGVAMHLPGSREIERASFYGDTTRALGGVEGGFEGSRDTLLVPPRGAAARTATLNSSL